MPNSQKESSQNTSHIYDGMRLLDAKRESVTHKDMSKLIRYMYKLDAGEGNTASVMREESPDKSETTALEDYSTRKGDMHIYNVQTPKMQYSDTIINKIPTPNGILWEDIKPGDPGYKTHRDLIINELTGTPSTEQPQQPAPSLAPAQRRALQEAQAKLDRIQRTISELNQRMARESSPIQIIHLKNMLNQELKNKAALEQYIHNLTNTAPSRKYGGILNYANYFK